MGSAAAATGLRRLSAIDAGRGMIFDVAGHRIEVDEPSIASLRQAAHAQAGRSSVARDLAVLFENARDGHTLALRRVEAHTLAHLAAEIGRRDLAALLAADAPRERGRSPADSTIQPGGLGGVTANPVVVNVVTEEIGKSAGRIGHLTTSSRSAAPVFGNVPSMTGVALACMKLLRQLGQSILRFGKWLEPALGAGQGKAHETAFGSQLFRGKTKTTGRE
jgi:hypothetical protein